MNKTIVYIAMSLDGFISGKNDDISWLFRYNDVEDGFKEFFSTIGAVIKGKRSYEIEIQHGWENPHPVPTFILTHHVPEEVPKRKDIIFTAEDIEIVLKKAKELSNKDIWIEGGANVVQQFLRKGLIDEFVISVVPVILGGGVRLFGASDEPVELLLREVRQFDKGLVQLIYEKQAI